MPRGRESQRRGEKGKIGVREDGMSEMGFQVGSRGGGGFLTVMLGLIG